jgi:hypothetical protein
MLQEGDLEIYGAEILIKTPKEEEVRRRRRNGLLIQVL